MKKAIEFSVKHPVSALMYFSLAIFLGAISVFCMNTSLLPKTRDRFILASTNYDGVRAEEIRKLVTIPLEQALASLKDVKNIESVSRDGSCAIQNGFVYACMTSDFFIEEADDWRKTLLL